MALLLTSHSFLRSKKPKLFSSPSLLRPSNRTTSLSFSLLPTKLKFKFTPIRSSYSDEVPDSLPSTSGWNQIDTPINEDGESDGPSPTYVDEWGEKSEQENEPSSKLPATDPPRNEDEWGEKSEQETVPLSKLPATDPPQNEDEWGDASPDFSVAGNGSAAIESGVESETEGINVKVEELKRCLVDTVYGSELGFRASPEERGEILELVTQLEGMNPTPAPLDAVEVLDGNWVLLYTAFSELLPLLAAGTTPLLKVEKISQAINTRNLTIDNTVTFSSPFATFSLSATADFEVRSPSRIQVKFKEGTLRPPEIKSTINLPESWDIFGQTISLSPLQQSLSPLQQGVESIARVISGQAPIKLPIPGERSSSWLLTTYLDKDLRISRGDGGLFVLAKEGSPLLDQ